MIRHFRVFRRYLSSPPNNEIAANWRKFIGLSEPKSAKRVFVPVRYVPSTLSTPSQQVVADLKWLMQKIKLRQDIFLIGPPSRYRSQLVLMMLELLDLEYEYIMLNRDTSESDLKQRKELMSSAMSSVYVDQCVVRAAANGRVLILDGVEKAERNLLPIINNLVENREMQLEDGRFMLPEERYRKLAIASSKRGNDIPLVPVHNDFRVICIGLPTPPFRGQSLDPPFRSRFQARKISHWPLRDQFLICGSSSVDQDRLARWLSFANAMCSEDIQRKPSQVETVNDSLYDSLSKDKRKVPTSPPPYFPVDSCLNTTKIWENCPLLSGREMIEFVYPAQLLDATNPGCSEIVKQLAKKFDLWDDTYQSKDGISSLVSSIELKPSGDKGFAEVALVSPREGTKFLVPCGSAPIKQTSEGFVETEGTRKTLLNMLLAHSVGDFCVVGDRGCGKTANIIKFARLLGYGDSLTTVMLYQDITGRDLLQQRITREDGATGWEFSPIIRAALDGNLLILDGIHVLNTSTALVLRRLVEDREAFLPDGSRALRYDRYDSLKVTKNMSDEEMKEAGILRIHPAFRIIAIAEPPTASKLSTSKRAAPGPWLTPDINTMFLFVSLPPPTQAEEFKILQTLMPNINIETIKTLVQLDAGLLSLRQKLRILRLLQAYPQHSLFEAITSAALHRFMPLPARTAFTDLLTQAGIKSSEEPQKTVNIIVSGNKLTIGDVSTEIFNKSELEGPSSSDNVDEAMRIPSVLFYNNQRQISSMALMLKALLIGEHLLVIGNQGVGKNRIVDRLLELWARPRHYAQLHRDSTVQSLTVIPSVTGGRLHFEDSPLVKAVRAGHILVLDEVDKAPVHVTRVLKGLVESGNMLLPDGRRISATSTGPDVIPLHPDFRLIALANPPGYPFLGNNFFASLGDLFSCHIVDNPDFGSELELVKNYAGPSFDQDLLRRLTASFADLRSKANEGLLPYPYSTRELISVVKHLTAFPNDSVNDALRNVFDFDSWNEAALDVASSSFGKFGIKIERKTEEKLSEKRTARLFELPGPVNFGQLIPTNDLPEIEVLSSRTMTFDGPTRVQTHRITIDQADGRLAHFSELTRSFSLDLPEKCTVQDATVSYQKSLGADVIHLYTMNPPLLISFPLRYDTRMGSMVMLDGNHLPSPFLTIHPFAESITDPESSLLLFDSTSGFAATLSTLTGKMFVYSQSFAPMRLSQSNNKSKQLRAAKYLPSNLGADRPFAVSYRQGENFVSIIDFVTGKLTAFKVPLSIRSVSPALQKGAGWFLFAEESPDSKFLAGQLNLSTQPGAPWTASLQLYQGSSEIRDILANVQSLSSIDNEHRICLPGSGKNVTALNIYSVFTSLRNETVEISGLRRDKSIYYEMGGRKTSDHSEKEVKAFLTGSYPHIELNDSLYLDSHSLLVSSLGLKQGYEPSSYQRILPFSTPSKVDSVLEVVHVPKNDAKAFVQHIPMESSSRVVRLLPLSNQNIASVMANGQVRVFEVLQSQIQQSLSTWQARRGGQKSSNDPDNFEKAISELLRKKTQDYKGPKHGKVDPDNDPHVGGNQWAGGSGGRDTAGMGGSGGPYRLDSGNPITQVPDWVKDQVPDHIKTAAREVAQRTYEERLRQIKMSKFDAALYDRFASRVTREVALLRNIIESLPSSKKERVWLKNQSEGDLDENRLIDGLTGEKSIYKRRVDPQSAGDPDSADEKPRLLSLVVDVSGSMARFNSTDMRFEREAAAVLMVMESLANQGEQKRVVYEIYGHSGETDSLEFCRTETAPKNAKERLDLLLSMQAHSMFCAPGDTTIQSISRALSRIKRFHADSTTEKFVVLFSDANLSRYGIPASSLAQAMTPPDLPQDTRIFAIMIGSLGSQAESLVQSLPPGQGYVCMDTSLLPQILQQILTTTLLMQD